MSDITAKIKETIQVAFNKASVHRKDRGHDVAIIKGNFGGEITIPYLSFHQPPVVFERKSGMKGLSCQYFLPPDLLPRELQEYGMISIRDNKATHERLSEVW